MAVPACQEAFLAARPVASHSCTRCPWWQDTLHAAWTCRARLTLFACPPRHPLVQPVPGHALLTSCNGGCRSKTCCGWPTSCHPAGLILYLLLTHCSVSCGRADLTFLRGALGGSHPLHPARLSFCGFGAPVEPALACCCPGPQGASREGAAAAG